jgi:hypothetical protein
MADVQTCERCGGDVAQGDHFCGSCGAPVERAAEPPAPAGDDPYVTFLGAPAVGGEFADEGDTSETTASADPENPPLAPTVIGIRAIRPGEEAPPPLEPEGETEASAQVAPTVIGMPAISMPTPAEPAVPAAPSDEDALDVDPELEAEIEAMRAAARAEEEAARRREAEEAEAQRQAEATREAELDARRREAEAEAQRQADAVARRRAEAEADAEPAAGAEPEPEPEPEPDLEASRDTGPEPEREVLPRSESGGDLSPAAAPEPTDEPAAVTADAPLEESLPYRVFHAHLARLDEFVHPGADDPAGWIGDSLRRSGFVLVWMAFDAFVRDVLASLVERHPAALLAAADEGTAVSYGELLAMSDGLESLDGLRAALAASELDRLRGRLRSTRDTVGLIAETFGFEDPPLPADYVVDEDARRLDADAVGALEARRDELVHGEGAAVTIDELADAEAALTSLARRIATSVASGRYRAFEPTVG